MILIGLGLLIFYLLQPRPATTPTSTTKISTPSSKQATPKKEKPKDETADWKTYTSKTLGVTFKYPKEWDKTEESTGRILTYSSKDEVSGFHFLLHDDSRLYTDLSKQEINQEVTTNTDFGSKKSTRLKDVIVDGQVGLVVQEEFASIKDFKYRVYVNANGKYYDIYTGSDSTLALLTKKVDKFFYQALPTVGFIK